MRGYSPNSSIFWGVENGCSAWREMDAAAPREEKSDNALEGDAAHEWLEIRVEDHFFGGQDREIEKFADFHPSNGFDICDEMEEGAQLVIDTLPTLDTVGEWGVEFKIKIPEVHPSSVGAVDLFFTVGEWLYVYDYKFGRSLVEFSETGQLVMGAKGVLNAMRPEQRAKIKNVGLYIVQPRGWHTDGPVRFDSMSIQGLEERIKILHDCANVVEKVCRTGKHCSKCSAYLTCDVARRSEMSAVDVTGAAEVLDCSPEELAFRYTTVCRALKILETSKKKIQGVGESMIAAGGEFPGYEMKNKRNGSTWEEDVEVVLSMASMVGLNPATFKKESLVTPNQAIALGMSKSTVEGLSRPKFTAATLKKVTGETATSLLSNIYKKQNHE